MDLLRTACILSDFHFQALKKVSMYKKPSYVAEFGINNEVIIAYSVHYATVGIYGHVLYTT